MTSDNRYQQEASGWIKLNSLPWCIGSDVQRELQTSQMVMVNANEFIIAPHWTRDCNAHELQRVGLFKYVISDDKWSLFMPYSNVYNPQWNRICFDADTNLMYSSGNRSSLTTIDLNRRRYVKHANIPDLGSGAFLIIVHCVLHLIGGSKSNKHYIWNTNTCTVEQVWEFKSWGVGCTGFSVIHIKSQNKLFLFGGYLFGSGSRKNEIWSHDLDTKTWTKLQETIPCAMNSFDIVVTTDERHAILFGGFTGTSLSDIVVIDLHTMACLKSVVQMPKEDRLTSLYHAIRWDDRSNDEILIHGFIRFICCKVVNIPMDVMQLIAAWYSIEYVFLISTKGHLWKMPLNLVTDSNQLSH
eukprot:370430_1